MVEAQARIDVNGDENARLRRELVEEEVGAGHHLRSPREPARRVVGYHLLADSEDHGHRDADSRSVSSMVSP